MSINELIFVVFNIYEFLTFHITVRIKYIHHYLILKRFL